MGILRPPVRPVPSVFPVGPVAAHLALSVRGLSVAYRRRDGAAVPTVHEAGFELRKGETLTLVGESGSGKSTIALAVAGLLPANGRITSGSILMDGTDVAGFSRREWQPLRGRVLGYVPQDPLSSLDPLQSVGVQLARTLVLHGIAGRRTARAAAIALLRRVGIRAAEHRFAAYPHQLSGGQLQRVLIAIAIAARPAVLIADEPTSALDVTVQKTILDLIGDLQQELGLAVLLITHDLALARERSQSVVVLNQGRVCESGPADTLMAAPRHPYTARLLADAPGLSPGRFDAARAGRPALDEPAIRVMDLTKSYPTHGIATPALDGVSFSVRKGSVHALVGESGSGKTTAARIVAGLAGFEAGAVEVLGRRLAPVPSASNRHARELQLVYQNALAVMNPRFTVRDIIEEPLRIHGVGAGQGRRAAVREALNRVGLGDAFLARRPRELSGGQRQRVAIARALALEPDVLVLDEPTSALDVTVQMRIVELLIDLQARDRLTFLVISHDLSLMRQIADEVTVLSAGRVVESGTVERVFTAPAQPYTARLLAAIPGLGGRRAAIPISSS